jgi:hypothetical protein
VVARTNAVIYEMSLAAPSLEDVFLQLTEQERS